MRPRLTLTRHRTQSTASTRPARRERRQQHQLDQLLASRPQHVRDEVLEMLSRAG